MSSRNMGSDIISNTPTEPPKSSYSAPKRPSGTGMKLGGNKKDVSSFVDKLASEGVTVEEVTSNRKAASVKAAVTPDVNKERSVTVLMAHSASSYM